MIFYALSSSFLLAEPVSVPGMSLLDTSPKSLGLVTPSGVCEPVDISEPSYWLEDVSFVVLEVSALLPRPDDRLVPAPVLPPPVAFLVEPPALLFEELRELEPLLAAEELFKALLRDAEEPLFAAPVTLLRDA
jgi:hypothetical protein